MVSIVALAKYQFVKRVAILSILSQFNVKFKTSEQAILGDSWGK